MGEAKRRAQADGLRVLNGGQTPEPAAKSVPLVQFTVLAPAGTKTAIEERYPLVAHRFPARNDFVVALLAAGLDKFDAEVAAMKHAQEERAAARVGAPSGEGAD